MLVIGDKEQADNTIAVRTRKGVDKGAMTVGEFLDGALDEINTKAINL